MTQDSTATTYVYIGSYTESMAHVQAKSRGISVFRLDPASGALTPVQTLSGLANPSYLAVEPRRRCLYAVEEIEDGRVCALRIDPASGALTLLNRQSSHGNAPAHLSVDGEARNVLVANYENGSIAVLPIHDDGSLGPATAIVQHVGGSVDPERQQGPHAHYIVADPANRLVLVADLGLDAVLSYQLDSAAGALTPHDTPSTALEPGGGPRHLAFSPDGRYAYVINELDSTLTACAYDAVSGRLRPIQRLSTIPAGFEGEQSTAAVRVAPSGRFVYGSNRGHDSIAIFTSDPATGVLTLVGHESTQGATPRDFNIDPTGTFLLAANQDSDTVVTFRIDQATGRLSATGHVTEVMTPVCIVFYQPPS
jgi:6-phosphogluconolactonase